MKVWCLCEATSGYVLTFEVCKGKDNVQVSGDIAKCDRVMRLMEKAGVFHQGHHLRLDNCFSSPKLFLDLWRRGTTAAGAVNTNCQGLPMGAIKKTLKNKQVSEYRKGPLSCVAYKKGKKTSVLLSTSSKEGYTTVHSRKCRRDTSRNC